MPTRVAPSALRLPSLLVVVKTDFLALLGALAPVVGAALAVAAVAGVLPDRHRSVAEGQLAWLPAQPRDAAAVFAAALAVAGAALIAWRMRKIRAAFGSGHRVEGTITRLRPFKDRAYVHYSYRIHGAQREVRHFVHQTAAFRALAEGQAITVAVDPATPGDGFVVELFEGERPR
jgi:hypothetical protein